MTHEQNSGSPIEQKPLSAVEVVLAPVVIAGKIIAGVIKLPGLVAKQAYGLGRGIAAIVFDKLPPNEPPSP